MRADLMGYREREALLHWHSMQHNEGPAWRLLEQVAFDPLKDEFTLPDGRVLTVADANNAVQQPPKPDVVLSTGRVIKHRRVRGQANAWGAERVYTEPYLEDGSEMTEEELHDYADKIRLWSTIR